MCARTCPANIWTPLYLYLEQIGLYTYMCNFDVHILSGFSAAHFNQWTVDVWIAFFIHQSFNAEVHIKPCLFVFFQKPNQQFPLLIGSIFSPIKIWRHMFTCPVFPKEHVNNLSQFCSDCIFHPWKFHSRG